MPNFFPSKKFKSTRKLVFSINAIKTYYNKVKSELYQTLTNSYGESTPPSENKVLAIYHCISVTENGLWAQIFNIH